MLHKQLMKDVSTTIVENLKQSFNHVNVGHSEDQLGCRKAKLHMIANMEGATSIPKYIDRRITKALEINP